MKNFQFIKLNYQNDAKCNNFFFFNFAYLERIDVSKLLLNGGNALVETSVSFIITKPVASSTKFSIANVLD